MTPQTFLALLVTTIAMAAPAALAAPLDLDADFGACGVAQARGAISAVLVLPDGKIVTAGDGLAHYERDGRPDRSFGVHGVVAGTGSIVVAAALQADGKIVATATRTDGADSDVALLRWLPDGSADPTFGDGGTAVVRIAGSDEHAAALAIQDDGKLVVAGRRGFDAFLLRVLPDGAPDRAFGPEGILATQGAPALARQADGKLVTAAIRNVPGDDDYFVVRRYLVDGSGDGGFGVGGIAQIAVGDGLGYETRAMAVQSDGAIVVAGGRSAGDWRFARFLPDGTIDWSFGWGGIAGASLSFDDSTLYGFVIQPDGKLVMAGTNWEGEGIVVERFLPNGTSDPSFTPSPALYFPAQSVAATAIALAPDGRLLVGGSVDEAPAVMRFLGDCDPGKGCRSCPSCQPHPNSCGAPRHARLRLSSAPAEDDVALWRWAGPAVVAGLGNPEDGYDVALWNGCELLARATFGEAATCGARPCWKTGPRRQSYQGDSFALRLRTDGRGTTAIVLKSSGGLALRTPTAPLTVVLSSRRYGGPCWHAFFDRVRDSGHGRFRAETER